MIAVIADDLTGAAEIAGIGWRHGLKTEILTRSELAGQADLIVYDSDSRLCSAGESSRRVTRILKRLQRKTPDWIYKKVDSVLRGNVVPEVEAALSELDLKRCLLVSANPKAGRTIQNGRYFIQGIPIDQTDFRNDPHHPRSSSRVRQLLRPTGRLGLSVRKPDARTLPGGVIVGEAGNSKDLRTWVHRLDDNALPAGGAEFFTELLGSKLRDSRSKSQPADRRGMDLKEKSSGSKAGNRTLFICGSLAQQAFEFMRTGKKQGWPILFMPDELASSTRSIQSQKNSWAQEIASALQKHPKVIMAIGRPELSSKSATSQLGRVFIEVAARVLNDFRQGCVCLEGGATAAALTHKMKWTRLSAAHEFASGVVAVRPRGWTEVLLVLKPGSYKWPASLL